MVTNVQWSVVPIVSCSVSTGNPQSTVTDKPESAQNAHQANMGTYAIFNVEVDVYLMRKMGDMGDLATADITVRRVIKNVASDVKKTFPQGCVLVIH